MTAIVRTNEKLRFAQAILDDLKTRPGSPRGNDFQRAREEAFLYHLHGARDAFLHEVNEHYRCDWKPDEVTLGRLKKSLRGVSCPALEEIARLEGEGNHTLRRLREWRNASTHRSGVSRRFYQGGDRHGEHAFANPFTGEPTDKHINDEFEDMLTEVATLLSSLRDSLPPLTAAP